MGRPDLPRSLMSFTTRDIPSRHSRKRILKEWSVKKYRILQKGTGNVETAHALIVKNSSNDNICLVFSCSQMASTNTCAGIHCLAFCHEWMHCFYKLTGAPNGEVLPELVNLYKSIFYLCVRLQILPMVIHTSLSTSNVNCTQSS